MPTKNLVPRQDGEGKIGVKSTELTLKWKEINAVSGSLDTIKIDELKNQKSEDLLKGGSGVTITRAEDAQDGFQYTISASSSGFTDKIEEGQAKVEVVDTIGNDDATIQFWGDPDNNGSSEKIWEFDKDGHLIPDVNETYDIGKAEKKVRHLFLSDNSLHIGTTSTDTSAYATGGANIYKLGKNNLHKLVWNSNNTEKTVAMEDDLHAVAFSGNYTQLNNLPSIPDSTNDITSDIVGQNYTGSATDNLTTHLSGIDTVLGTINTTLGTKVTQADIDSAIQGIDVKESVRVATTGVLTGFSYVNAGTQQWQETSASGALTIDDVVLANGDRVLVKNAAAQTQNGIYIVSGIDGSSQVILDRSADLDNSSDFGGAFTFVEEGTTNIGNSFVAKNASSPNSTTVGTNTQNWTQFNSAGSVAALNDLSDVTFTTGTLTINGLNTLNLPNNGSISNGILDLKNGGASTSEIRLYCENQSTPHYTALKSAAHGTYSGNITFTLPSSTGQDGQSLVTDGNGVLSWASQVSTFEVKAATDATINVGAANRGFSGQIAYMEVASPLTIDGVTINLNDKILVKDSVDGNSVNGFFNGVYYYKSLTSGTIRLELLRGGAYNYNISSDFTCHVLEGTANKFKTFALAKTVVRAENSSLAPTNGVIYPFFESVIPGASLTRIAESASGKLTYTPLLANKTSGDEQVLVGQVNHLVTVLGDTANNESGAIKLNCENNSHGVTIQGPPHSSQASYTLTLPSSDGNPNQVLKTDGSGGLSWVDQSTSSISVLNDLTNVNAPSPLEGQAIVYDSTTSNWVASDLDVPNFEVAAATTTDLTGIQNGSGLGVVSNGYYLSISGATLTIDGYQMSVGDRLLVKDKTGTPGQNPATMTTMHAGIYKLESLNPCLLLRLPGGGYNIPTKKGTAYYVQNGTNNGKKIFVAKKDTVYGAIYQYGHAAEYVERDLLSSYIQTENTSVTTSDTGTNGNVNFTTDGVSRWDINSDGHFVPATNNLYDIGLSANKVKEIHTNNLNLGTAYFTFDNSPFSGNDGVVLRTGSSDAASLKIYHNAANTNAPELSLQKLSTGAGETNGRVAFYEDNTRQLGLISSKTITVDGSNNPTSTRVDFSTLSKDTASDDASTIGLSIVGDTSSARPKVRIADTWNLPTDNGTSGYVLSTNGSGEASWASTPSPFTQVNASTSTVNLAQANVFVSFKGQNTDVVTVNLPTGASNGDIVVLTRPIGNSAHLVRPAGQFSYVEIKYQNTLVGNVELTPGNKGSIILTFDGTDWIAPHTQDSIVSVAVPNHTLSYPRNFGAEIIYSNRSGNFTINCNFNASSLIEGMRQRIFIRGTKDVTITSTASDIIDPSGGANSPTLTSSVTLTDQTGIIDVYVYAATSTVNYFMISPSPAGGGSSSGVSRPSVTGVSTQTNVPEPSCVDVLEDMYIYNSSNVITTTLPDITNSNKITAGFKYQFKNIGSADVTINAASGEYIDFSTQTSITIKSYDSYTLTTDGSNWFII